MSGHYRREARPARRLHLGARPTGCVAPTLQLLPPEGLYSTGLGNRGCKLLPKSPRARKSFSGKAQTTERPYCYLSPASKARSSLTLSFHISYPRPGVLRSQRPLSYAHIHLAASLLVGLSSNIQSRTLLLPVITHSRLCPPPRRRSRRTLACCTSRAG